MAKKLYGSLNNRFDEGKNYTHRDIQEGDDITMYYWSDRHCYWITKVIDQKHIFVKEYQICADHSKKGGMGHQDWMYFKTAKEEAEYLKKFYPDRDYSNYNEPREQEWVYRYNKWHSVDRWNMETICNYEKRNGCRPYFTPEEEVKLLDGKEVVRYHKLEPISFGVRDYHYDWEF